jgi:hypothetical protein
MGTILYQVIKWSEVWALLIPLIVLWKYKPDQKELKPLIVYVIIAFLINSIATPIGAFSKYMPEGLKTNTIFYNIHSIVRVFAFGLYLAQFKTLWSHQVIKFTLPVYVLAAIVNFTFWESPGTFSIFTYAIESILVLAYCICFFLASIQDDSDVIWMQHPAFIICSGISFYESISFFIFLFLYAIDAIDPNFTTIILEIFSVAYIILCIIFAIMFKKAVTGDKRLQQAF